MQVTIPSYYKEFKCAAGACKDSCCVGWEIDIDHASLEKYQNLSGTFGERLRSSIDLSCETPHFILKEAERCPFLNEENLCDVILTLGEDSLCEICANHPRFFAWYGDWKEAGVGLCCEAAAELIFRDPAPARFESFPSEEQSSEDPPSAEWLQALLNAREVAFSLLQDRSFSIPERLALLLSFGSDLQDCLDFNSLASMANLSKEYTSSVFLESLLTEFRSEPQPKEAVLQLWKAFLNIFSELEPIDPQWPSYLKSLNAETLLNGKDAFFDFYQDKMYEYEHLAVYFIYRYFLKAVFDGDLLFSVKLTVSAFCVVFLTDLDLWERTQNFTFQDRIESAKHFSKEIEYSTENLETLAHKFTEKEPLSFSSLLSLLLD